MGQINESGCERDLQRLREMKNVHFLGSKKIKQVPNYIKAFDVGIIPYKLNEQTENLSPLKLYDFLAMGKKIVITDVPVAREFTEVVRIASSHDAFFDHIAEALNEDDQNLFEDRRRIAAMNTWGDRVEKLSEIITSHL
jgi:glycosyltransferase involved in cell wall biosynthesis